MALWDVLSGCVLARLEDAAGYRDAVGGRQRSETYGVMGLAWVVQRSSVLAVLLAPATLLLWDTKGEYGQVWPLHAWGWHAAGLCWHHQLVCMLLSRLLCWHAMQCLPSLLPAESRQCTSAATAP